MIKGIPELLSRIVIGFVFIESGFGKLNNLNKVVSYFESLHIPLASLQAPMVAGLELACGILILVGFLTRLASLPLLAIMAVALATAKAEDIAGISDLFGTIEFLYIVILSWLAALGANIFSMDHWCCRRSGRGTCHQRVVEQQ